MYLHWDHGDGYLGSGQDTTCAQGQNPTTGRACGWLTVNDIMAGGWWVELHGCRVGGL